MRTGRDAVHVPAYSYPIRFGEAVGVELEYMIVDADSLDVRPIADELIRSVAGAYQADVEPDGPDGVIGWSNELALHVIELKTIDPVRTLDWLSDRFQDHVRRINELLGAMNARLMPTSMHPWMDPDREMRLWPHEYSPIYAAYDRIFSCRGHGWANLQSTHINLPFGNDDEFGRLHAAIRLLLPIMPALAAASPVYADRLSGFDDSRMDVYRRNAVRVPSVAGLVVPEPLFTRHDYENELLGGLYRDIAPFDPDGVLRFEWLNSRGCIARFDRGSIEIRVLDIQECPQADLAIIALINAAIEALQSDRWTEEDERRGWAVEPLHEIFLATIHAGDEALIDHPGYLRLFGLPDRACSAGVLWRHLADELISRKSPGRSTLDVIFQKGTLARRLRRVLGPEPSRDRLRAVFAALCDCLADGRMFTAEAV